MRRGLFFLFLVWLGTGALSAQHPDWENYGSGWGCYSICPEGDNLWLATSGGVARVGRQDLAVTHYNHANSGLPYNRLYGMALDPAGTKWLYHGYSYLIRWDAAGFTQYPLNFIYNSINSLAVAGENDIWLGTDAGGLAHFDGTSFTQYTGYTENSTPNAEYVTLDPQGRVWFSTYDSISLTGNLVCWDGQTYTLYNSSNSGLPDYAPSAIAFDAQGQLWVGTFYAGVYHFDGEAWTSYTSQNSGLLGGTVYSLKVHPNGSVWIGTSQGVSVLSGEDWTYYNTGNSALLSNTVYDMFFAPDGVVWLASKGLARVAENGVQVVNTSNSGLTNQPLYDQVQDATGAQWIAGFAGLFRFDGQEWDFFDPPGPVGNEIWKIDRDSAGNLWLAMRYGGAVRFDGETFTDYTALNSPLPNNLVRSLAVDSQDRVWIATQQNGLFRLDGETWTSWTTANSLLPDDHLYSVTVDPLDQVWVCSYSSSGSGGMVRIAGETWTLFHTGNSGLPSNLVLDVELLDGVWWFATGAGLASLAGTEWTVFTTANSPLPDDAVTRLEQDQAGNLWIATRYGGLAKLSGDDWTLYNFANSGLAENYCNYIFIDAQGRKWVGHYSVGLSVYSGELVGVPEEVVPAVPTARIWPNPFRERVTLSLPAGKGETRVTLYNLRGQKLREWLLPGGEQEIDLQEDSGTKLARGIYLWKLEQGGRASWIRSVRVD